LSSPFVAIAQYEREKGLPPNYLNVSMSVSIRSGNSARGRSGRLITPLHLELREGLVEPGRGLNEESLDCLTSTRSSGMIYQIL